MAPVNTRTFAPTRPSPERFSIFILIFGLIVLCHLQSILAIMPHCFHDFRMRAWWDRHVVPKMIGTCCGMPQLQKMRAKVVPMASGRVLELGAGGAANLPLYDRGQVQHVTGIDPSPELIALARRRMTDADTQFFSVLAEQAEDLPFDDDSFDSVVTTFTLCTVGDQARALQEAKRVLKPGGQLLFLEHGLAPDARTRRWQHRLDPIWCRLAGGCHLHRPVTDAIVTAGFRVPERHGRYMPRTPSFLGWMEWGTALKNDAPAPSA